MAEKSVSVSGGLGFPTMLFLVFLVLKLTGVIAWSWLWVLAPLWIPLALGIVGFAIFVTIVAIIHVLDK